jgi:serine/threonine protein kinase
MKKIGEGGYSDIYVTTLVENVGRGLWPMRSGGVRKEEREGEDGEEKKKKASQLREREVVLKVIKMDRNTDVAVSDFRRELWIMNLVRHPFLVSFIKWCPDPLAIMMEYLEMGDLRSHLLRQPPSFTETLRISSQVSLAMHYLHSQQPAILHLDLKSMNVLLTRGDDDNTIAKVSDFGRSHYLSINQLVYSVSATSTWTAPEILRDNLATRKSDVYSYGLVLWEIVTQQLPYMEMEWMAHLERSIIEGYRPKIPESVMPEFAELIQSCWHTSPEQRPFFDEIIVKLRLMCDENLLIAFSDLVGIQSSEECKPIAADYDPSSL